MAEEKVPVLSGAISSFEYFMTAWETMQRDITEEHPMHECIAVGLKWAAKYYQRMDGSDAYVISMCKLSQIFGAMLRIDL